MDEGGRREGVIQDGSSQSGPMDRAANAMVNTPQSSPLVWEGGWVVRYADRPLVAPHGRDPLLRLHSSSSNASHKSTETWSRPEKKAASETSRVMSVEEVARRKVLGGDIIAKKRWSLKGHRFLIPLFTDFLLGTASLPSKQGLDGSYMMLASRYDCPGLTWGG